MRKAGFYEKIFFRHRPHKPHGRASAALLLGIATFGGLAASGGELLARPSQEPESAAVQLVARAEDRGAAAPQAAAGPGEPQSSLLPANIDHYAYSCESGASVTTAYDADADRMWVLYRGEVQVLGPVQSGSGAKFGAADVPWGWWSKGDQGLVLGYEADGSEGEVLDRCSAHEPIGKAAAASNQGRRWSLELHGDAIALLDCVSCGDDIGAVLECQGPGEPARLSIFWAAVDTEDPLTEPLRLEVAGEVFERPAETAYAGQIGRFPQIRFGPNDPLVRALKVGDQLRVRFAGVETLIGLRGFTAAFSQFDQACPWHPGQTAGAHDGQGVDPTQAPSESADTPRWMLHHDNDPDTGSAAITLTFGIPETDATAFQAVCSRRQPGQPIEVVALVDPGARAEGEAVDLVIEAAGIELRIAGEISTGRTTYPGVRTRVAPRHPLWPTLQGVGPVSLRVDDGPSLILPASSSRSSIETFLSACMRSGT